MVSRPLHFDTAILGIEHIVAGRVVDDDRVFAVASVHGQIFEAGRFTCLVLILKAGLVRFDIEFLVG